MYTLCNVCVIYLFLVSTLHTIGVVFVARNSDLLTIKKDVKEEKVYNIEIECG